MPSRDGGARSQATRDMKLLSATAPSRRGCAAGGAGVPAGASVSSESPEELTTVGSGPTAFPSA
jgi:hypothetical protein